MEMIFCAEIGSNHKGIPSLAHEYIRQVAIVNPGGMCKFQLGHRHDDPIRGMPNQYAPVLKRWCENYGIEFFASIFSWDGLGIARRIGLNSYKMASRKAFSHHSMEDYDELFAAMMSDDKPIYVSDGQVPDAHNVHKIWCVSEYPTYPEDVTFPEKFGDKWYGYSSHAHGLGDKLKAIALGAKYVEAHVTTCKAEDSIKDNHFALTMDEFAELVRLGKDIVRFS